MIIVDAAAFDEDVTIEKNGIVLVGTTDGEAMTTLKSVTINAKNVVLEGLTLTATTGVNIKGGENITITECKLGGTASANTQTILLVSAPITGLQVLDCEFFANNPNNNSHYRAILSDQLEGWSFAIPMFWIHYRKNGFWTAALKSLNTVCFMMLRLYNHC